MTLKIGDVFVVDKEFNKERYPEKQKFPLGEYVVVETAMTGGGTGHGRYDIYPDGHCVYAKKLTDGKYDESGKTISFFQTGCFNNMHPNVPVVRKMQRKFV
jgi:hypothetical protein